MASPNRSVNTGSGNLASINLSVNQGVVMITSYCWEISEKAIAILFEL